MGGGQTRRALIATIALVLLALGGCAVHDAIVPVPRQFATRALGSAIEQYREHASPRVGRIVQCRFRPSCSAYGLAVVRRDGAWRGGWKALVRIARCNPMTPMGTIDPP